MINLLLNRKNITTKIDKIRDCDGTIATSPQLIAEKFNEYFTNIAEKLKSTLPQGMGDAYQFLGNSNLNTLFLEQTNSTEISSIINNLKVKATSDLNVATIKKAASLNSKFSQVITDVINVSFTEGIFPSALKIAKTVPIYKAGSKIDIENYRPISLLSAFSKIYEKIMYDRIYCFLTQHKVLIENQFGFRRGRSCEDALLTAQNEILNCLTKKQTSLLLLIDFSKAFDMVDHDILLRKLDHYGIRGVAHAWIKSYLSSRKQYVALNNKNSKILDVIYGVPQGSVLGPLLFLIYINDIPNVCELAKFIMYADDANILITGNSNAEIEKIFTKLANNFETWVNSNGLIINLKKTNYMIFANRTVQDLLLTPKLFKYEIERK